jgi:hypothetical protein
LEFWRWLLNVGLPQPKVWSVPLWFLAGEVSDREVAYLYTDASTSMEGPVVDAGCR